MKMTRMGCTDHLGGVTSAISTALMPKAHTSTYRSCIPAACLPACHAFTAQQQHCMCRQAMAHFQSALCPRLMNAFRWSLCTGAQPRSGGSPAVIMQSECANGATACNWTGACMTHESTPGRQETSKEPQPPQSYIGLRQTEAWVDVTIVKIMPWQRSFLRTPQASV